MPDWMLEAPMVNLSAHTEEAFKVALQERDANLLPAGVPHWLFLDWLAQKGYLLHGSKRDDITLFEPRPPHDLSPDAFSKRTGVFAASDGLWAMMYALRGPQVKRMLNMALQSCTGFGFGEMKYFLSLAPRWGTVSDGRTLLTPGFVYVLPPDGFIQMPAYDWPGLGTVQEPHWVNPNPVEPLMCLPVKPQDFPLPVRVHHAGRGDALCASDPWGFPWLCENGT
ncbi:hypothetical protein [Deinococcus fonticola]|uniref:hypothetical protein n=1 Tax=Deinococcus fonticola TaxID=2528713 RepID=UPI00107556B8|nr:hypothetical protein [Deinococcus fonticola]